MNKSTIKQVIVVFKTHLDIGFTGYAKDVLQQYCTDFIPAAVELAFQVNTPAQKKFVWTVGSYLIKYYFDHAEPAACERLAEAIRLGYVRWHGLACTTHTELMDRELLSYNVSISKALDERFGMHTIAAKMTDVPGHTIGLVPVLSDAGIEYLHLGVNASSRVPSVPLLFRWRCGEKEIVVNYAGDYGDAAVLENGTALEFFHAHDNAAPPTPDELEDLFKGLADRYPNASIQAGTLEDFALSVREVKDTLPVLTEEIGDTWIHGAGTDPLKVSQYQRLLALKKKWLAQGKLTADDPAYQNLMENLLLIAEHTWGMDVKKYLLDFENWDKASFTAARAADDTFASSFGSTNLHLLAGMKPELHHYHGEEIRSSYSRFESSHQEQRDYITNALALLPENLKEEAASSLRFTYPVIPEGAVSHPVFSPIVLEQATVMFGANGELIQVKNHETGYTKELSLGRAEYEIFGGKEVDDCYFDYGRDLKDNFSWSEPDFGKPGLRFHKEIRHQCFLPVPTGIYTFQDTVYVTLAFAPQACEEYGCPRQWMTVWNFENNEIHMELYWKEKDAIRSPEALWLHMDPGVLTPEHWFMDKSGTYVSPTHVVYNGNRKLHCVQGLHYCAPGETIELISTDAPLVSPGEKSVYSTDNRFEDLHNGFYFQLYNNRWGTNFKQWFDEDMRFAFHIAVNQTL
ncbi:MAG: DUF5054 domain-containing protein [Clostridiales bacterium]|nr:DUF5054 domain-containing protein [Clostridiales bacterium]